MSPLGSFNWQDVLALGPVDVMIVAGCVLLLNEVALKSRDRGHQAWISAFFAAIAFLWAFAQRGEAARDLFGGLARLDAFGSYAAMVVTFALALTSLIGQGFLRNQASERGEFHALAHFAAAGMVLLVQATDLVTLFVALEVMSLAVYALVAWLRSNARPAEAALKYFVLGSFASAILLFGASLAFGAAGSTKVADIAAAVQGGQNQTLLFVALALLTAGFLFKVAAVPFHMWAPDVYEGAPTPVTGFMAAGVKVAAFGALLRILYVGFGADAFAVGQAGGKGWFQLLSVVSVATMVGGNILALAQKSVKRMLAYSSITHAGYLLLGVAVGAFGATRVEAAASVLYYLAVYAATAVGAFAVVGALETRGGNVIDDDGRYDGLAQREPALALAMAVFVLSLAGIPPAAGFTAKLFVFRAALDAHQAGLAVIGLLSSVVGLYYYLRVLVLMYMKPSPANVAAVPPRLAMTRFGLVVAAVLLLVVGALPATVQGLAQAAAAAFAS